MAPRVLWRLLPSLVVLLAVWRAQLLLGVLRALAWAALRLLHVAVLLSGALSFWWVLRSYQLSHEQEIYEAALLKHRFYERYRRPLRATRDPSGKPGGGNGASSHSVAPDAPSILEAGFQLKVVKRLPIVAHLRTSWSLAPEICDEIAALVNLFVRDYVAYWFQPISPNDDFPSDVKFLLADLIGALVARLLEIDSTQALTMAAKSIELLRLHLGWFREAYAQLSEEHPLVFQGEESDQNLRKRQELMAVHVQRAKYLHPGCVSPLAASGSTKKAKDESGEAAYLRHVASQLLIQLKPELGQQYATSIFVSIAMNLIRECIAFKGLKPIFEYSQPRYANELVVASLQSVDVSELPSSPTASGASTAPTGSGSTSVFASGGTPGLGFNVPLPPLSSASIDLQSLKSLQMTKSFLYRASKRSSEQAEAALQAVFDAMSTAATHAGIGSTVPTSPSGGEIAFDGDYWAESAAFGAVSPRSPTSVPGSPPLRPSATPAPTSSNERKSGHFSSLFSLEDRISFHKTSRIMGARAHSGSGNSYKSLSAPLRQSDASPPSSTHMDDLKSMKANLESSLNSSLFKVKKTFKNIGGHLQDAPLSVPTTTQAANLMKKPGRLLQKALRRTDTSTETPIPIDEYPSTPPPLDPESPTGFGRRSESDGDKLDIRSPTQPVPSVGSPQAGTPTKSQEAQMQDRVLLLLEKTISSYVKLYNDRPEMRSSSRSRELYELLSALEDVFMLGYRKPDEDKALDTRSSGSSTYQNGLITPPNSPTGSVAEAPVSPTMLIDPGQLYWNYLAQDRPDTPFLNDHWQFVDTQCPLCAESDTFYSTRGVQWILIALEKGMLWEYFTALHLNRRLTELFYEEVAVLRNGKLMEKVLKSLFQLNKLHAAFEIPRVLGRESDFEVELGIGQSHILSTSSQVVRVVETTWEVERYVPLQGWVKSQDKRTKELPSSEWVWETEWTLENAREVTEPRLRPGRRLGSASSDSSDVESQTWEYGKSFDDRFHDKEKKLDSVRRRKWTRRRRQLPPVLCLATTAMTNRSSSTGTPRSSGTGGGAFFVPPSPQPSSPIVSPRRQSSRLGSLDDEDLELRTHKKNPAMLTKRRSFSGGKELESHPLTRLVEDVGSPTKTRISRWRRKKRSLSASLKRTTVAHSLTDARATKSGSSLGDDDLAGTGVTYVEDGIEEDELDDEEDDDNFCFRCFKTLGGHSDLKSGRAADACQSCHQRVCSSCHNFYAFLVYPPPLESTKKEKVCGGCYERFVARYKLKVDAHVGKYFIRDRNDRDSAVEPLAANAGSNSAASGDVEHRYEVTVQLRDESAYAWSVVKTFGDFEQLEKELYEKYKKQEKKHGAASCRQRHWKGVDYCEALNIEPTLRHFAATASSIPYEKKLFLLEEFLQRLLACDTLCQSSVVQKFLLLGENLATNSNTSSSQAGTDQGDGALAEAFIPSPPGTSTSGPSVPTGPGGVPSSGGSSSMVMVENGKWRRGKWIAPETSTKETKMRVLQKLEVSLFAVLNEVFEMDGFGMLRRHLLSMTRSFIRAFLSASHFRMLERQFLSFTDPKKMAGNIAGLRAYMFPETHVEPPPAQLSAPEMEALRKKSLEAIVSSFPSTIVSVFGENSSANAALKLHEFLQHEVFVKNLFFSLSDELLPLVFPDIAPYTPKAKPAKSST